MAKKKRAAKTKRRVKGRRGEEEEGEPVRKRKRASKKRAPQAVDLSQYPPEIGTLDVWWVSGMQGALTAEQQRR